MVVIKDSGVARAQSAPDGTFRGAARGKNLPTLKSLEKGKYLEAKKVFMVGKMRQRRGENF